MNIYEATLVIDSPAQNVSFYTENGFGYRIIDYNQREKTTFTVIVEAETPEKARQKIKEKISFEDKDTILYDIVIKLTDYIMMI